MSRNGVFLALGRVFAGSCSCRVEKKARRLIEKQVALELGKWEREKIEQFLGKEALLEGQQRRKKALKKTMR